MTQMQTPGQQIGEEELDELEALADDWVDRGGMPLEALDGFFSALVVGPDPVPNPTEFLPVAVGAEVEWKDREDASHAIGLLMKLWNHVAWRVAQTLPDEDDESDEAEELGMSLMPIVGLPAHEDGEEGAEADPFAGVPADFPLGALWASGFMQGVAMREEAWEQWMQEDEDLLADMRDIALLGMVDPDQAAEMGMDWEERYDLEERWQLMASVPALLQDLHLSRLEQLAAAGATGGEQATAADGACLCGSGREWKECCGTPTLH